MAPSAARRPRLVAGLRLIRPVGRGGEGEVWEARDHRGRRRALKLILPEALAAPDDVDERANYLLRIDHPALVRVHRSGVLSGGDLDGWGFVEMDFVDGSSLQDAAPDTEVLERLEELAEALDLLHAGAWSDGVPLVHRDVKPANLVQTADGRVVLVDPSTLRGVDATHLTRVGTPVFSAPEVLTGRIGPAADVYSFAVTVVALVTGARGSALAELVDSADRLDLPDGVRSALSARPGDRPVSCRAVLEPAADIPRDLTAELDEGWLEPLRGEAPADGAWLAAEGPHAEPGPAVWSEPAGPDPTGSSASGAPAPAGGPEQPPADAGWPEQPPADAGWPEQPGPATAGWPGQPGPARAPRSEPAAPAAAQVPPAPGQWHAEWHPEWSPQWRPEWGAEAGASEWMPRSVWPWLAVLATITAVPVLGWASGLGRADLLPVLAAAATVHLAAHGLARRSLALALVLPPLAWGLLLADRVAPPRSLRHAWVGAQCTGALALAVVAPLAAVFSRGEWLAREPAAGVSLGALVLTALAVAAVSAAGTAGWVLRLALTPLWLVGAGLVVTGGVAFLPVALLTGHARATLRLVGATLGGAAEIFRGPRAASRGWQAPERA